MTAWQVGGVSASDACFVVSAALLLLSPDRDRPRPRPVLQVAGFAALVATLLASLSAVDAGESVLVGLRVVYLWTIWRWQIRVSTGRVSRIHAAAKAYLVGCGVSAAIAVLQITTDVRAGGTVEQGRATGLTLHVNDMGGTMAVAIGFAFALLAQRRHRKLAVVSLATSIIGLFASGSVSALLAAGVGVLAVLAYRRFRLRVLAGVSGTVAGGLWIGARLPGWLGAVDPLVRLQTTTSRGSQTSTLDLRLATDRYAWSRILANPWTGAGLDATSGGTVTFSGSSDSVLQTHNLLLLMWFQGGLLLLLATLVVVLAAVRALRHLPAALLSERDLVAGGLMAALAFSMTGPILFQRYFWFPVFLVFSVSDLARRAGPDLPGDSGRRA